MNIVHELIYKPVAFFVRDFKIAASYRLQFVMQGTSVFFSVAVFFMLSRLITGEQPASLAGYGGDYFAFALIGIAFADYLTTVTGAFSAEVRSGQVIGTLESLLVSPTSIITILLSSYLYTLFATSLRVLLYFTLGLLVFNVQFQAGSWAMIFLTFILILLPFVGIGLLSAAFIIVLKQGSPIGSIVAMSSGLLGGVLYPVSVLPGWLRFLSDLLPITYGLEAMRKVLLNGAGFSEIKSELGILLLFSVIFLSAGIYAISVAVRIAKREGSLLHY